MANESLMTRDEIVGLVETGVSLEDIAIQKNISLPVASTEIQRITGKHFTEIKNDVLKRKIRKLVSRGKSLTDVAQEIGVSISGLSSKISDLFGRNYLELSGEFLKKDLDRVIEGKLELDQVRRKFNYSPLGFHHTLSLMGFSDLTTNVGPTERSKITGIRAHLKEHRRKGIDKLVDEGYSASEIATKLDEDRQLVDIYIRGSSQYNYWLKRKEVRESVTKRDDETLRTEMSKLAGLIQYGQVTKKHVISDDSSVRERVNYYMDHNSLIQKGPGREPDKPKFRKLLTLYFKAVDAGEHPSLRLLARGAGYTQGVVAEYHLKKLGLPQLNGTHNKITATEEAMIKRTMDLPFSASDIKKFTGTKASESKILELTRGRGEHISRTIIASDDGKFGAVHGSYFEASQIYQAIDIGLVRKRKNAMYNDLEVLFPDLPRNLLEKIIDERERISPIIVNGLRTIKDDPHIKTPYLS